MTDKLQHSLSSIRSTAPRLNQATNDAQAVVTRVEAFLNDECSLGLPCEVVAGSRAPDNTDDLDDNEGRSESIMLVYARIDGRFRIGIRVDLDATDAEGNFDHNIRQAAPVAWASAPRDLKLITFKALPGLLESIAEDANKAVAETDATVETAKKVLAALGGGNQAECPSEKQTPARGLTYVPTPGNKPQNQR